MYINLTIFLEHHPTPPADIITDLRLIKAWKIDYIYVFELNESLVIKLDLLDGV